MRNQNVVVVGLGEVGKPLFQLMAEYHRVIGVDIQPSTEAVGKVDVLHICFPFAIKDFTGECVRYIEKFSPNLTIINSTVSVGTTRTVANRSGCKVVNSPVRGKHARMLQDMKRYEKFIGAVSPHDAQLAADHFQSVGLATRILSSPEASELSKLTETTYLGVLIAWAQEVERYCDQVGVSYDEVVSIYDEIKFYPPVKYFPGVIGGHCVMPNISILNESFDSQLLQAIQASNALKIARELEKQNSKAQCATVR
ncbi:MAG TPA: hypothetical protein VN577_05085 [Terriglobales bacterium]|nr:hypothetical protein [Terriglobales bacterium]